MSRPRFDELWSNLRWSQQPNERPPDKSHAEHRWMLIDDMVNIFNRHREENFIPSEWICVDESISRWYGLGRGWINIGLPMYIAIDRKPESGCELQNSACGSSGVMLRLLVVKNEEDSNLHTIENNIGMAHGTAILKYLTLPWANSQRGVCADSYFASVSSAEEMLRIGLRFIGVVKTATKKFPMTYLSSIEFIEGRGQCEGVVLKDNQGIPTMMSYTWMDKDRQYFISKASSLAEGNPYQRIRWRQQELDLNLNDNEDRGSNNEDPIRQELTVPQPKCSEIYYDVCASIDQHNRHRQDTLRIERKIETKSWDKRVTTSLFGIYVVDTWLMYKGATTDSVHPDPELNQQDFYCALAEELIERGDSRRNRRAGREGSVRTNPQQSNSLNIDLIPVLRPVSKRKRNRDGSLTPNRSQGRCKICYKGRPTTICSLCEDSHEVKNFFCDPRSGRDCFEQHKRNDH